MKNSPTEGRSTKQPVNLSNVARELRRNKVARADKDVKPVKAVTFEDHIRLMDHHDSHPPSEKEVAELEQRFGPQMVQQILTRPRRNQKHLRLDEKKAFNSAIEAAMRDGKYQELVAIHTDMTHDMHRFMHGNHESVTGVHRFLPWHRVYLYQMEKLLQTYVPYLRIPYWDWINDRDVPSWLIQPDGVTREPGAMNKWTGRPNEIPNQGRLNEINDAPIYDSFTKLLQHAHDEVHAWVGGAMSDVPTSPNDPLFFLHHANVDRIWNEWRHPKNDESARATAAATLLLEPVLSGTAAILDPWPQYTPSNVADTLDLFYYYTSVPQALNFPVRPPDRQWPPGRPTPRLGGAPRRGFERSLPERSGSR